MAVGDYCTECGAYKARKPQIELERDAALRGWVINIVTHDYLRGTQVFVPDNSEQWDGSQPLTDGVRLDALK